MAVPSMIRDAVVAIIANNNVSQLNIQILRPDDDDVVTLSMETDTANLVSGCTIKIMSSDWSGTLTNTIVNRNYYGNGKHRIRCQYQ